MSVLLFSGGGEKRGLKLIRRDARALSLSMLRSVVRQRFPGFHLPFLPKQTSNEGDVERERVRERERAGWGRATMISYLGLRDNHLPRRSFGSQKGSSSRRIHVHSQFAHSERVCRQETSSNSEALHSLLISVPSPSSTFWAITFTWARDGGQHAALRKRRLSASLSPISPIICRGPLRPVAGAPGALSGSTAKARERRRCALQR